MTTQPPAPDWYPDPSGEPGLMYWDGRQWHTDVPAQPISTAPQPQRPRGLVAALVAAVAVLIALVGVTSYLLLRQSHPSQGSTAQPAPQSAQTPQPAPSSAPAPKFQYLKTPWGTRCRVSSEQATCQTCIPGQVITNAYTCTDPIPADAVNAAGIVDRNPADIGSSPDIQQLSSGQTYHVIGWSVVVTEAWVRFINDATGHGMAVAAQNFDSF